MEKHVIKYVLFSVVVAFFSVVPSSALTGIFFILVTMFLVLDKVEQNFTDPVNCYQNLPLEVACF